VLKGFGYNHRDYNQLEQPVVADTKRIMLIDPSLDIGFSLKVVLEEEYLDDSKLEVDIFTDSLAALDNFRIGLYDLVITAAVMSKINGFEVYTKLRELDDIKNL
jgi:DNA-binding response OmpR family regulator